MAGEVLDTRAWVPTPAAPTQSYTVGAGVSGAVSVQITNNTLGELWLNDSGRIPGGADSAKYVIPPRATATFPLGAAQVSLRWNSLASGTADLVTFVFSDGIVTPNVIPGVNSVGGSAAPVIAYQATVADNGGAWPKLLTTTSGKNVGNVWVYNNSALLWRVQFSLPSFRRVFIRPYSWACIPCNQPSGSVDVGPQGSLINELLATDSVYVAYSDVDYVLPFPTGAGDIPNPITTPGANPVGSQFTHTASLGAAGNVTMRSLGIFAGAVQRVVLDYIYVSAINAGVGATNCNIGLSGGYDGISAAVTLASVTPQGAGGVHMPLWAERRDPIVVANLNNVAANNIVMTGVNGGSLVRVDATIAGRILT